MANSLTADQLLQKYRDTQAKESRLREERERRAARAAFDLWSHLAAAAVKELGPLAEHLRLDDPSAHFLAWTQERSHHDPVVATGSYHLRLCPFGAAPLDVTFDLAEGGWRLGGPKGPYRVPSCLRPAFDEGSGCYAPSYFEAEWAAFDDLASAVGACHSLGLLEPSCKKECDRLQGARRARTDAVPIDWGGHAFPIPQESWAGMNYRQYAAAQAVGHYAFVGDGADRTASDPGWAAARALEVADALIALLRWKKGS